jgi:hypothetical protein
MLQMMGASRFLPPSHRYYRHQGYHMPLEEDDEYDEYQGSGQQWEMNHYPFNNNNQLEV